MLLESYQKKMTKVLDKWSPMCYNNSTKEREVTNMKVKELIARLETMPADAEVIYHDGDNGWLTPGVEYTTELPKYVYSPRTEYIHGSFVDLTADC
jgi:hypothetical protein